MRPLQTALAVLALLSFGSYARGGPEEPRVGAAKAVAGRYYALVAEEAAAERETAVPASARKEENVPSPPNATGMVVDRRGRPVVGARVAVESWGGEHLGEGRTGAGGRFDVPVLRKTGEDLGLEVTAPGFDRWAVTGYKPHELIGYRVRLDRELGRDFLAALAAEPALESRIWGLLEIVGERQFGFKVADVYPSLGVLRADLRAIVESQAFLRPDDPPREGSPDELARELLAYWGDPADEPLFRAWVRAQGKAPSSTGGDLISVCATYAQYSFKKEGAAPPFSCVQAAADAAGTRALVDLNVRYAYWGYTKQLVLMREGTAWKLRFVVDGAIYHGRG
jgi:hypothetical protein